MKTKQTKKSKAKISIKFIFTGAVLLSLTVSAAGVYYWRQLTIDSLDKDKKALIVEKSNLETKNNELKIAVETISKTNETLSNQRYRSLNKKVQIEIYTPLSGAKISSPLIVSGRVPGNWSFEANFPISIQDSTGKVVAYSIAQVLGDWMTTDLVPFTATLTWENNSVKTGNLILNNDNPSALKENEDSLSIPIIF